MIFYTADMHFNHKNAILYDNRPFRSVEEMNEVMIGNWNSRVTISDEVFILGDFAFGKPEIVVRILHRLNGKKYLLRGNHDSFVDSRTFDLTLFQWVKDIYYQKTEVGRFVLCHYPIVSWQAKEHGTYMLHGHTHTKPADYAHPMLLNVGVDNHKYFPISVDEVIDLIRYQMKQGKLTNCF